MKREINGRTVYAGTISHKRSKNVAKMEDLCGPLTWYVGDGEGEAYRAEGASSVVESGGLCRSRNAILDDAFADGLPAVELSDDLKKIEVVHHAKEKRPATFEDAVGLMFDALETTGTKLCGVAPTSNAFFYNPKKPIHKFAFIVGDMLLVLPSKLRFDEQLRLKEDYDFTLQHIAKFGGVARQNQVLATFAHRTNKGGACDYRTSELEQETIAQLKAKWPGMIRDNKRGKDEILLALRG